MIGRRLPILFSHWLKPRLIHVSEMHFSNYFVVISGGFPDSGKQKLHANVEMWIVTQTSNAVLIREVDGTVRIAKAD